MKIARLYLETSVWNFCFADDAPEKKEITLQFFARVRQGVYRVYISDTVLEEIAQAPLVKRERLLAVIADISPELLEIDDDVLILARRYLREGILPMHKLEDAVHAAVATIHEVDALISWNLKHLANFRKMELINSINMWEGYLKKLELITPMEVAEDE